jgi:DUF4097 and DUF4098 domain-containing protein YvlB
MMKSAAVVGGLAAVLAATTLSGCGLALSRFSDDHTAPGTVSELRLDGGSGDLTVRSGTGDSVQIHRLIRYSGNRPGATDHVDGSSLVLNTRCGRNCSVNYTITTPKPVKVTGNSGSGELDLRDVTSVSVQVGSGDVVVNRASGEVLARTGSGEMTLTDVHGDVAVRTGSGDIRMTGIDGKVNAETSSGEIRGSGLRGAPTNVRSGSGDVTLAVTTAQDVSASTASGEIRLKLPTGSYRFVVTTGSGDEHLRVPSDTAGKYTVELHSGSGDVNVDPL